MSKLNRRADAARTNGALSKGPKTEEGRAKSSQNSITHGLSSKKLFVLSNEDPAEYDALLADLVKIFRPANSIELNLVTEMAGARWRLQRIWTIEKATMDDRMKNQKDQFSQLCKGAGEDMRRALAFKSLADNSQCLPLLRRYEKDLQRTFERAMQTLKQLRSMPEPVETQELEAPAPDPEIDSQNEPVATPSVIEIRPRIDDSEQPLAAISPESEQINEIPPEKAA
jgi:hypothetical protein